jgi:hypothetical protein
MQIYTPELDIKEYKIIKVNSAWKGLEKIISPIMKDFNVENNKALEFGVDYGFSTSVWANHFKSVIGVDTFQGDRHAGKRNEDFLEIVKNNLKDYDNITLVKSCFEEFIKDNNEQYDLIHIDIIHDYKPTFDCGEWAVQHAKVVVFHDTISFPCIKDVCLDLASKYNLSFYNYEKCFGLGILVKSS